MEKEQEQNQKNKEDQKSEELKDSKIFSFKASNLQNSYHISVYG